MKDDLEYKPISNESQNRKPRATYKLVVFTSQSLSRPTECVERMHATFNDTDNDNEDSADAFETEISPGSHVCIS